MIFHSNQKPENYHIQNKSVEFLIVVTTLDKCFNDSIIYEALSDSFGSSHFLRSIYTWAIN